MTPTKNFLVVEVAPFPPALAGPVALRVLAGTTIADVLAMLGLEVSDAYRIGVWGRKAAPELRLQAGDRIEFYRVLLADPKTARRSRVRTARR